VFRTKRRKTCRIGDSRQHKNARQDEHNSGYEGMRFGVAAGHAALDKAAAAMMLASHRRLLRTAGRMPLPGIVAMHRAHSVCTAAHSHALPSCPPQRCPEQHDRNQAHARGQCSSRSDRKLERTSHALEVGFYNRWQSLRYQWLVSSLYLFKSEGYPTKRLKLITRESWKNRFGRKQ
jgi:hypothetical protein